MKLNMVKLRKKRKKPKKKNLKNQAKRNPKNEIYYLYIDTNLNKYLSQVINFYLFYFFYLYLKLNFILK